MTVAFLAQSAAFPREARFCRKDFALRARVDYADKNATVIDRRYILENALYAEVAGLSLDHRFWG